MSGLYSSAIDPNGSVVSGSNRTVETRSPFDSASAFRHRLLQQIKYRNEKSSFLIVNSFGHRAEREPRHPIVLTTYHQIAPAHIGDCQPAHFETSVAIYSKGGTSDSRNNWRGEAPSIH